MAGLGFQGGRGGWWARTVSRAEKLVVLRALERELGDALLDLQVRDLEAIDLARAAPRSGDADAGDRGEA